jgi:hypothetical protein
VSFRPQDGALFFRDGENAALADGTAFQCILEWPEDVTTFAGQSKVGQVQGRPSITYPTAAPGRPLAHGDALTVDGDNYTVRYPRKLGDGTISQADLAVVNGD